MLVMMHKDLKYLINSKTSHIHIYIYIYIYIYYVHLA